MAATSKPECITEDEAEEMLLNDLSDVEQALDDVVYRYESQLLAMVSLPSIDIIVCQ